MGGEEIVITVDDYIPVELKYKRPWFAKFTDDNEFWPIILEKAYSKMIGSYAKIEGGRPKNSFHALTG